MITWKMCPFPYAPEVVDKFWQMLGVGQPLPVERWYSETPRHELSSVLVPNRYLMAGHDDCWHVGNVQWWVALDGVVGCCCMLERVGACHPRGVFANAGVWDQQLFGGSDVGRGHRLQSLWSFCGGNVYSSHYAQKGNIEDYLSLLQFYLESAVVAYPVFKCY